ncbi:MAG: hypothetical protein ACOZCO_08645 [Bacteroidota bacterium]
MKKYFKRQTREKIKKAIAVYLSLTLLFEIVAPTCAYALTGGPSQPEVQGFEPIGTSDMVDLFSGDFTYNIPLLDIDGYPINISYNGGISMDQEASWVGLGWNLNPGVVNRAMRGLPDDFSGDEVRKEYNIKPNKTFGVTGLSGLEIIGLPIGLNAQVGVNWNNYSGMGIEKSINPSLLSKKGAMGKLNVDLGLNSSSDNGLSVQPSVSFELKKEKDENHVNKQLNGKIGASFNSRMGLQQLTYGMSAAYASDKVNNKVSALIGGMGSAGGSFDLGMPTYTPDVSMPMHNLSITGSFKLGASFFGADPTFDMSAYVSVQNLREKERRSKAYGYMNAEQGQDEKESLLDFNRENEGSFTINTPALAVSNYTYDLFTVSGQGVGGSYRPFRSDIGHIFDPYTETTSNSGSIGVEIGTGNLYKGGVDISVTHVESHSGDWTEDNAAGDKLSHVGGTSDSKYEKFFFKEANEKSVNTDNSFYAEMGSADPVRFQLNEVSNFNIHSENKFVNHNNGQITISDNTKEGREKRNQVLSFLTHNEVKFGMGIDDLHNDAFDNGQIGHHIAEITTLGTDGRRYVYGIAAYNTSQREVSFAVGDNLYGDEGLDGNCGTGLVKYEDVDGKWDNTRDNQRGLDNYFSATNMPAYAHSYLLTCVLSADYVDADATKGPSKGDLGTWIKFNYEKVDGYNWRTPVGEFTASYNEGLKSDPNDDKASYTYGTKELWYVESIETKNYIAKFVVEDRKDGYGVTDEDGNIVNTNKTMKLLRKISLHTKRGDGTTNPVPIKEVHFEYDYSLCPNVANNPGDAEMVGSVNLNANKGKLTLKRIFFTYQNSNKAKFSPYKFEYNGLNPEYNLKAYDRWGNYKPNDGNNCNALSGTGPSTAEFPYVDQSSQANADSYTSAWSLTDIFLPSGGKIHVDYESDDYAYVQHKRASQMFKIVGVEDNSGNFSVPGNTASISDLTKPNRKIFFEVQPGFTNIEDYIGDQTMIYFRCLMEFDAASGSLPDGRYDYVSGYAELNGGKGSGYDFDPGSGKGWIKFKPVKFHDSDPTPDYHPISKAAIQFGRTQLSRFVWDQPAVSEGDGFGADVLNTIVNSSFVKNINDALQGPNLAIWSKERGRKLVLQKSWIRLYNPSKKKLGGGCRVNKISMSDEWSGMTNNAMDSYQYGQQYEYKLEDGTSSGVASYEPQLGGDENTFKQPVFFTNNNSGNPLDNLLVPDERYYQEEPLGESFFPSASVGYSRVTVKNIQRTNVTRTATGKVVHEFYTARDFPTITKRTEVNTVRNKNNPFSVANLFNLNSRDHMTASQGFVVELNDMHGKPKKQMVYQEDQNVPITEVEYKYKSEPLNLDGKLNYKLKNTRPVIFPDGNVSTAEIGVFFDMVADMRENFTKSIGGSAQINADGFLAAILPVVIPMVYPSVSIEETQFRSAATTKVIQRFGILDETIARDLGSKVSTRNLAYDSETGEVLLTQTKTDFNDDIFSLTYPSHWVYDGMAQAYKNIGYRTTNISFNANGMANIANAHQFFAEGDEVVVMKSITSSNPFTPGVWIDDYTTAEKVWITDVTSTGIKALRKDGTLLSTGVYSIKVLRSGRRNMQAVPVSSITTLKNPLDNFSSNIFEKVLQSSAMEFSQDWNTFCECFEDPQEDNFTTNPYVLGIKGNWRMKRSWLHLSPRTQSNYDNNTNIRRDGIFTSYTPFYKLVNGKWNIDENNWTFTSEVTEFSPFGQELENRDALGRYSAATFGFNQSLATAVAANSRYRELGFDSFEDYQYNACSDDHFKFSTLPTTAQSHTGKNSVKVSAGSPVVMNKLFENCTPPGECAMVSQLTIGSIAPIGQPVQTIYTVTASAGSIPYAINYDLVYGNYTVNVSNTGDAISFTGTGPINVILTITDAKGCTETRTINQ